MSQKLIAFCDRLALRVASQKATLCDAALGEAGKGSDGWGVPRCAIHFVDLFVRCDEIRLIVP